jgi:hypothetical protein
VALDEGLSFKLRERPTVFVPLGVPHPTHEIRAGVPEATDGHCVTGKMIIQDCPMRSDRRLHGALIP